MGHFKFNTAAEPALVLARLRMEARAWRASDMREEIRAVGEGLAVDVDNDRFRAWIIGGRAGESPVAVGRVFRDGGSTVVQGRIRLSRATVIGGSLFLGWSLYIAMSNGSALFGLIIILISGAGLAFFATRRVPEREAALRSVLASIAAEPTES